jgi:hypothetical protein
MMMMMMMMMMALNNGAGDGCETMDNFDQLTQGPALE